MQPPRQTYNNVTGVRQHSKKMSAHVRAMLAFHAYWETGNDNILMWQAGAIVAAVTF